MKIIVGDFYLARAKASLTILAPSPMYIWTKCGPASLRNVAFVWAAHALAIIVFPVPGGPNIRHPLGGRIPIALNLSLWVIGSTIASLSYSICLLRPPISPYCSEGFSSTSIVLTLESYSAGSFSNKMYESLLTPISSPGLSSAGSTRPGTGRNTVFLVLVFITTAFPSICYSTSTPVPKPTSGSSSSISTTLDTSQGSCLFCLILAWLSLSEALIFPTSCFNLFSSDLMTLILLSIFLMRCLISSLVRSLTQSLALSRATWGSLTGSLAGSAIIQKYFKLYSHLRLTQLSLIRSIYFSIGDPGRSNEQIMYRDQVQSNLKYF